MQSLSVQTLQRSHSFNQNSISISSGFKSGNNPECSSTKSTAVYSHKNTMQPIFSKEQTTVHATTWMTFTDIILSKKKSDTKE